LDFVDNAYRIGNNGPTIHNRDVEAIFEQGFSRKPGGRGLGLFISKKALRKEGMDLNIVQSKSEERGVIFEMPCLEGADEQDIDNG